MNVSCASCRAVFRVDPAKVPLGGVRARCSECSAVISVPAPEFALGVPLTPWMPEVIHEPVTQAGPAAEPTIEAMFESDAEAAPEPIAEPAPEPMAEPAAVVEPAVVLAPPARMPTAASLAPTPVIPMPTVGARPAAPSLARPAIPRASAPTPRFSAPAVTAAPVARASQPASLSSAHTPVSAPSAPAAAAHPPVAASPPTASPIAEGAPARVAALTPSSSRVVNPFMSNDPGLKAKRLARALVSDMVAYLPHKREEGVRDGTLKQLFREEIKKSYEEYVDQVGTQLAESTTHFQDALNDILGGGKKIF